MKVITWNLKSSTSSSKCWEIILNNNIDICLLQDVISIPNAIKHKYFIESKYPTKKNLEKQKFSTVCLVKKGIVYESLTFLLESIHLEKIYKSFLGNIVALELNDIVFINFYNPYWEIPKILYDWSKIQNIRLKNQTKLFLTEILYGIVSTISDKKIVLGGDFNHSLKFDEKREDKFNSERFSRFNKLGIYDALTYKLKKPIPTFIDRNKKLIHQLDYMFVSEEFLKVGKSNILEKNIIYNNSISDHLPIYFEF
jgi:exonuclease III